MFLPIKDDNPNSQTPIITWALIIICVLTFIWQSQLTQTESQITILSYGIIPAHLFGVGNFSEINPMITPVPAWMTIFTSMFLHGGFSHIMGNMWFLWVFGDNVEGVLGHAKYALFYILCGLAATISQLLINPESSIPMVGASGAIAGVLGMYMIRFPNANVHVFAFIIIFFTTFRIPALFVLGFWFFNQLTSGLSSLGFDTTGGVAWFAHIGGFVAGVMLNQAFKHIRFE